MNKAASSVNQSAPRNSYNLRIFLLLCVLTLAIGSVGFRLFYLQVVHHGYYKALADNQHTGEGVILPKRGQIYFSPFAQGTPLLVATNVVRYTVSASIKNITDADKTASNAADVQVSDLRLDVDRGFIGNADREVDVADFGAPLIILYDVYEYRAVVELRNYLGGRIFEIRSDLDLGPVPAFDRYHSRSVR